MQPYRVLLVDDEEDIRVGISRKMDWESLGFRQPDLCCFPALTTLNMQNRRSR